MKQTLLTILLALFLPLGGWGGQTMNTAMAESRTVTYKIKAEQQSGYPNRYTFTFVQTDGSTFGYSTGEKTATVNDISATTGFYVNLDDGLRLHFSMSSGQFSIIGPYDNYYGLYLKSDLNAALILGSSHYCVTHVKITNPNGDPLYATAAPWTVNNALMDVDVDMVTESDGLGAYRAFSARFATTQIFGQLTITYGDPRDYDITYTNAVNGQDGVTNTNPTSYNVTTNSFQVTAPTRTGYTFGDFTYTDTSHPNATAASLPMTISRGDAVQRKAITFVAAWTAHTYTLRLHHNDGTDDYDDMAMTYDEAQTLPAVTRTGYVLAGWSTTPDGSVEYTDGQGVSNLTTTDGDTVDLYAQWTNPSGTCGDNATWEYDHATTTLTISGSGEMSNYGKNSQPWKDYKAYITTVVISNDITYIGDCAFYGCSALTTVSGGSGITSIGYLAFRYTDWLDTAQYADAITYLGHVLVMGRYYTGTDVVVADGTTAICEEAFSYNSNIRSVTIPASVTSIGNNAFYNCRDLSTVNVLATTPPELVSGAFSLPSNPSRARTFNVRSAAYKTAEGWADIYNKDNDYEGHTGTVMRVISTLALPSGMTATAADGDKVTAYGTDYYAEGTSVTIDASAYVAPAGASLEGIKVNGSSDGVTNNGDGTWSFTMPAEDATVNATLSVSYIDENGDEQTCTDYTVIESSTDYVSLGSDTNDEAWYVVPAGEVTINGYLDIQDKAVHLILCDGAELNTSSITCSFGSLTIYGQTLQSGELTATSYVEALDVNNGDLTVNGGTVIATSANGSGIQVSGANFIINRGSVTATSNADDGCGISVGSTGKYIDGNLVWVGGDFTINGGTVSATGGRCGISADGTITLGWTNPDDFIYASSYWATSGIDVKDGQALSDGSDIYTGPIDADDIADKTLYPFDYNTPMDMTIGLTAGWNWVSFYVETDLDNLKTKLVEATSGNGPIIINSQTDGCTVYDGTSWKGALSSLDVLQMYQIMVGFDCELQIEGVFLGSSYHEATMCEGYNWIGFPCNADMTVSDAFEDFAVNGDQIYGKNYSANYNRGRWTGRLTNLSPGQGYIYKSNDPNFKPFVFPSNSRGFKGSRSMFESHWLWSIFNIYAYKLNQPVVASIQIDNQTITCNDENWECLEVAAFVDGECRGCAFMRYDPDEFGDRNPVVELPVYYTNPSEVVTFKLYDHANGIEYDMGTLNNEEPILTGGEHVEFYTSNDENDWLSLNFTNGASGDPVDITLENADDNSSVIEENDYVDANVILDGRTLYKDGAWNTLCLPFYVYDFTGTPLEDAEVRSLNDAILSNHVLTLYFSDPVYEIEAGKPYIVRWESGEDLSNPVFQNVTIVNADPDEQKVNFTGGYFTGTYGYQEFTDADKSILYMGENNTLYYPGNGASIGAFRAYFKLTDSNDIKTFLLNFGEDDATGFAIDNGQLIIDNETIYNVAGQRLNKMQKGINIVNGRKILK